MVLLSFPSVQMAHIVGSSTPPDLGPLLQRIAKAHSSPDDESLTEAAIIASVNYLQQLPTELHWLCNSSPVLPVVVQAIQLWGYGEPPAQAALEKLKPILAAALSRCPDCAVEWHLGFRTELKRIFTEVYSYDEVSTFEFYIALDEWDTERVGAGLVNAIKTAQHLPMAWKHIEVKGPLAECLVEPNLLLSERVFQLWKDLVQKLDKIPPRLEERWSPGAVVLIFDSDSHVRDLGVQMFRKRDSKINIFEFESNLIKPLISLVKRESQKVLMSTTINDNRSNNRIMTEQPSYGMV